MEALAKDKIGNGEMLSNEYEEGYMIEEFVNHIKYLLILFPILIYGQWIEQQTPTNDNLNSIRFIVCCRTIKKT